MNVIRFSDLIAAGKVSGQRVFIRADLNVPQDDDGKITEDTRIRASVPCIEMALQAGAAVMLTSHLGRPTEGAFKPEDSLSPVAARLSELLGREVKLVRMFLDKRHGNRGGFLRNDRIASFRPVEAIVCEGSGVQSDFARKMRTAGVPLHVNAVGSVLTPFFTDRPVRSYADATTADTKKYAAFFRAMLARGIYPPPSQFEAAFISAAHGEAELDKTLTAARASIGMANRFPTVKELYNLSYNSSSGNNVQPNPYLRPEVALTKEINFQRMLDKEGGNARIALFDEEVRDAIVGQTALNAGPIVTATTNSFAFGLPGWSRKALRGPEWSA